MNDRSQLDPEWSKRYVIRFLVWGGALVLIVLCCLPEDAPVRRFDAGFFERMGAAFWSCLVGPGVLYWIIYRYRGGNPTPNDMELLESSPALCALLAFILPYQAGTAILYLFLVGVGYAVVFAVCCSYTLLRILWNWVRGYGSGPAAPRFHSSRHFERDLYSAAREHHRRMDILDMAPFDDDFVEELKDREAQRVRRDVRSRTFGDGTNGSSM